MNSNLVIQKTELREILPLRDQYLREHPFQIRYHAYHERRWTDSYLISMDGSQIGYGSVKGKNNNTDRDTIFEFYLMPSFDKAADRIFSSLIAISGASFIECQTNDILLTYLMYTFAHNIESDTILFKDDVPTELTLSGAAVRKKRESDVIFDHGSEPVGDYLLEHKSEIVATGGFMLHYNKPFADLYMEVAGPHRKKGFGSFLLQEIKKSCRGQGYIPAARCNISNTNSRSTLIKAGFAVAGFMLTGKIRLS